MPCTGSPAGGSRTASPTSRPRHAHLARRRRPRVGRSAPRAGDRRRSSPPSFSVAEVSTTVRLANTRSRNRPATDSGALLHLASEPFPVGDPDHVAGAQRGHSLGDVEHLLDGRGSLLRSCRSSPPARRSLTTRRVRRGSCAGVRPAPSASSTRSSGHPPAPSGAPRRPPGTPGRARPRASSGTPARDPLDRAAGVSSCRRRPGHPGDQLVRLVDDHRVVLGQGSSTVHRVDGQQGVIGDDQFGGSGLSRDLSTKQLRALRAALRARGILAPGWRPAATPASVCVGASSRSASPSASVSCSAQSRRASTSAPWSRLGWPSTPQPAVRRRRSAHPGRPRACPGP